MQKKIMFLIFILLLTGCNTPKLPHNHNYIEGVCECGEADPNYHQHQYIEGFCSCGQKDPSYKEQHTHNYIEGFCKCGEKDPNYQEEEYYTVVFKDYDDIILKTEEVKENNSVTPPNNPYREGYDFIGWSEDLENITSDLIVYALYEKEKIIVGENQIFTSIQDAIDYAIDGDVIYINEGTYDGFIINKSIELRGNNYNVDPKAKRNNETTIQSDIIINASNVIINGVELINKTKFTFDNLSSNVENIKFEYCKVSNSTVNENNARNVAVFNLASNNNYFIKNITIDNCYITKSTTTRAMIVYGVDVEGIVIQNSSFYGTANKGSYNDGIKIDNKENGNASFGIKGNVIIKNNIFKNYSQYPIWFRQYSSGSYLIENNTFENVGQTLNTHSVVTFVSPIDCDNIEINVLKNTIINSYMLFRIDESNSISNIVCNVNQNIIKYSNDTCFIKNGINTLTINAKNNYYDTSVVNETNFIGKVDYSDYYENIYDIEGYEKLELYYANGSVIEVGETEKVQYKFYGSKQYEIKWVSSNENIAVVNEIGEVTGIKQGVVEIRGIIEELNIEEVIIYDIIDELESMEEVVKYLYSIMNKYSTTVTAANSRTNYGVTNPYLYTINRSALLYLFEDLEIDTESYPRKGLEPLANNKVEYITIHDTWALPRTAQGLAEYFQTDITSVHYTVGNDGIYQIVRLTDKAAHAGDSPYRNYALEKTNVLVTTTKPVITMIDGYFAINGIKTQLRPYTDYEGTVQDQTNYTTSQLTYSGIRCIIGEDGYYYLGKTYFNDTYKTVSNFGGNANSIGIEMESQKGTDFFLNMQRTAKLVAMLMDKFNLSTNDVKMHNFFSGKNCAQLLKNNLKTKYDYQIDKHNIEDTLWDEFLELCDAELKMIEFSKTYKFEFISSDTSLLSNTGRVIGHDVISRRIPYTIKITNINTNEIIEINSSIVIPSSLEIDQNYITK